MLLLLGLCACPKDEEHAKPTPIGADQPRVELALVEGGAIAPAWKPMTEEGEAKITADGAAANFACTKASFSLNRELTIDPKTHRQLSWRWRVDEHPAGGDLRKRGTDDQAAQLILRFEGDKIISYVWDATAPTGTQHAYLLWPMRALVLRSGAEGGDGWQAEERDILADYTRLWEDEPGLLTGVRLQSNCQHTGTAARATFEAPVFAIPN